MPTTFTVKTTIGRVDHYPVNPKILQILIQTNSPQPSPQKIETGQGWKKPNSPANPKILQILVRT